MSPSRATSRGVAALLTIRYRHLLSPNRPKVVARSGKVKKSKQKSNLSIVSMPVVGRGKTVMILTLENSFIAIVGVHPLTNSSCRLRKLGCPH